MPSRLLMAAEILLDVARTVNAADQPLLVDAAAELAARAEEICAAEGVPLDLSPATSALLPGLRGLAVPPFVAGASARELLAD